MDEGDSSAPLVFVFGQNSYGELGLGIAFLLIAFRRHSGKKRSNASEVFRRSEHSSDSSWK
jgi:hypothetical protein